MLVEAAWRLAASPGPLRAFAARVGARPGKNVAAVAVARKLAVLCWHLLTRGEDYAFARPSLTRLKLRRLQLRAGAKPQRGKRGLGTHVTPDQRRRETELALQAEAAYRHLVQGWKPSKRKGAGAATGARISKALKGQAARRDQAPHPAL